MPLVATRDHRSGLLNERELQVHAFMENTFRKSQFAVRLAVNVDSYED